LMNTTLTEDTLANMTQFVEEYAKTGTIMVTATPNTMYRAKVGY